MRLLLMFFDVIRSFFSRKLVFESTDKELFEKAEKLLLKNAIRTFPYTREEMPLCGCGARINPEDLCTDRGKTLFIFRLYVNSKDEERVLSLIKGGRK